MSDAVRTPDAASFRYPIWTRGDLDGFFGLMVDNLVQVLLIIALCSTVAGLPDHYIYARILPGVAISLLIGNVFYGVQAHLVARRDRNAGCTALPYGINTPSVVAYVLFIMGPVYQEYLPKVGPAAAADLSWKAGLLACLVSGVIEATGGLYAERLRRITPRAALLGVLAGIGITFIAAEFAFRIYTSPLVGLLPLGFLLLAYFAHFRFPWRLPGGFLAILLGTLIAWGLSLFAHGNSGGAVRSWLGGVLMSGAAVQAAAAQVRWVPPSYWGNELWAMLGNAEQRDLLLRFLTVSVPMGIMNVIGSLQNIESAEAGGDRFRTGTSLAVNGIGSVCAGLFGSCFPTTIYIGHPGWKALGARSGYSILNGLFFTLLFLFGLGPLLRALIPIEAGAAIVMYIGIIITAQAFQATPRQHAPAVAIALFPALAAFVVVTAGTYFDVAALTPGGAPTLADFVLHPEPRTLYLPGLLTLTGANSAWIIVTLVLAAIGALLIDRRYAAAAIWAGVATLLTAIGLLHAYRLVGNELHAFFVWQPVPGAEQSTRPTCTFRAIPIAIGYALMTLLFVLAAWRKANALEIGDERQPNSPAAPAG